MPENLTSTGFTTFGWDVKTWQNTREPCNSRSLAVVLGHPIQKKRLKRLEQLSFTQKDSAFSAYWKQILLQCGDKEETPGPTYYFYSFSNCKAQLQSTSWAIRSTWCSSRVHPKCIDLITKKNEPGTAGTHILSHLQVLSKPLH